MIEHDEALTIFKAGFDVTGEGFNGEYPNDQHRNAENVEKLFELWYRDYSVMGRTLEPAECKIVDSLADSLRMNSNIRDSDIREMALMLYSVGWRQVAFNAN